MLWGQKSSLVMPTEGCSLYCEGTGISPSLSHFRDNSPRKRPDPWAAWHHGRWLADKLTLGLWPCPPSSVPTNPRSPLNAPIGPTGASAVGSLMVQEWTGHHPTVSASREKARWVIHPEPFLTLPKFPDHLLHPSLSPSVKRDNEQVWGQMRSTHTLDLVPGSPGSPPKAAREAERSPG